MKNTAQEFVRSLIGIDARASRWFILKMDRPRPGRPFGEIAPFTSFPEVERYFGEFPFVRLTVGYESTPMMRVHVTETAYESPGNRGTATGRPLSSVRIATSIGRRVDDVGTVGARA